MEDNVAHRDTEQKLLLTIIGKSLQLFKDVLVSVEIRHIFIPTVHNCAEVSLQRLFQQTKWRDCIRIDLQLYQVGCCRFWVDALFLKRHELSRFYLERDITRPING